MGRILEAYLFTPGSINSKDQLNVSSYGVIVSKGHRSRLNVEGVAETPLKNKTHILIKIELARHFIYFYE